jgi:hypothetical protein
MFLKEISIGSILIKNILDYLNYGALPSELLIYPDEVGLEPTTTGLEG